MTFEEWLKEEYGTSFKGDFDDQFLIELEMAFDAGYEAGRDDEEVRWNDSLYGV